MPSTTLSLVAFYAITVLCLQLIYASPTSHVLHEKRDLPLRGALERRRIEKHALLPMRVGLKQNQESALRAEQWLMAVSRPDSPEYGKHWTQDQVIDAFQPSDETVNAVADWLASQGVEDFTHSDNRMWFAFDLSAEKAEAILKTEYYEHQRANGRFEVSCDDYYLPQHLQHHIDYVTPGIKGSDISGRTQRSKRSVRSASPSAAKTKETAHSDLGNGDSKADLYLPSATSLANCTGNITPACIRALYGIPSPDPSKPVSPNNSMGLFEQGFLYYQGDLDELYKKFTNVPEGTSPIFKPIDGGLPSPKAPKAPGWDLVGPEPDLDIAVAQPIIYPQNISVYQVDDKYWSNAVHVATNAGLFNTFLDALDGSYCSYSAYGETGNDPKLDPVYPDNRPHGYKGQLQCGVYKPDNVISISYGDEEYGLSNAYQRRQCNEWLKLGLQGVSVFLASGDSGVGPCIGKNERVFTVGSPNGCPWITNVGGTQIGRNKTVADPEEAVSLDYANYTSGGGFSMVFDAPDYQREALSTYFRTADPGYDYFYNGSWKNSRGRYNRNGRGIPDLAANGNNIAGWVKGKYTLAPGTSASAPLVGAIFNLINEERIRAGKGPVGFINPTLYQHPEVMNDVLIGNNTAPDCGSTNGFHCVAGWDPVTGLGTPNFPLMLRLFLALP